MYYQPHRKTEGAAPALNMKREGAVDMTDGQTERAIVSYERSLELNPGNDNAAEMLAKLKGDS